MPLYLSALPDVIHLEICKHLVVYDKIQYARMNRSFSERFLREVREIHVIKRIQDFFCNESIRNRILSDIQRPQEQLSLTLIQSMNIHQDGALHLLLKLLITVTSLFAESFLDKIHWLQTLILDDAKETSTKTDVESSQIHGDHLSLIAERMQSSELFVEDLHLIGAQRFNQTLPHFSTISKLTIEKYNHLKITGLNISSYRNLKYLKLSYCGEIHDVSSLDHIYELRLEFCHGISDISCLNHNYKIYILYCLGIDDYSKSFKYSRWISCAASSINKPIDIAYLEAVERLEVQSLHTSFKKPLPESLRVLKIVDDLVLVSIPVNNLYQLELKSCPAFRRLENMNTIPIIRLESLPLTSLDGLGKGNLCVTIDSLYYLKSVRQLSDCLRVEIIQCNGIADTSMLNKVREVHYHESTQRPMARINLAGVTSLLLNETSITRTPPQTAIRLREITIQRSSFYSDTVNFLERLIPLILSQKIPKVILQNMWFKLESGTVQNLKEEWLGSGKRKDSPSSIDWERLQYLYQELRSIYIIENAMKQNRVSFILK